jgi:hypothetical protein
MAKTKKAKAGFRFATPVKKTDASKAECELPKSCSTSECTTEGPCGEDTPKKSYDEKTLLACLNVVAKYGNIAREKGDERMEHNIVFLTDEMCKEVAGCTSLEFGNKMFGNPIEHILSGISGVVGSMLKGARK